VAPDRIHLEKATSGQYSLKIWSTI